MSLAVQKEYIEMALFGAGVGNAIGLAAEDKKIDFRDYPHLMPLLPLFPAAFDVPEGLNLSDISLEELEQVKTVFNQKFDIPQDKVEGIFEDSLSLVLKLYALAKKIQAAKA